MSRSVTFFILILFEGSSALKWDTETIEQVFPNSSIPTLIESISNGPCLASVTYFINNLKTGNINALLILDSWAAGPPSGLVNSLQMYDYGHFDRCLHSQFQLNPSTTMPSQYILSNMIFKENSFYFGACLPQACSLSEVSQVLTLFAPNMRMDFKSIVGVESLNKSIDNTLQQRLIVGFNTILTIVIASSLYDLIFCGKSFALDKLLRSFSVFTNGRNLLEQRQVDGALTCLDGIRVISFLQIVFYHNSAGNPPAVFINPYIEYGFTARLVSTFIGGGFLAVETFFLLSGFLLSYQFMKNQQSGASFNLIRFYLRRWIRLLPPAFLMQWTVLAIGRHVSSPNTRAIQVLVENYDVNPFVSLFKGHAYDHLWYITVEFRLSLVAPVFLFALKRFGYRTFIIIFPTVFASTWYQMYLFSINGDATFCARSRCGPWLLGLMLGYFIFRENKQKWNLPKILKLTTSIACTVTLFGILYWPRSGFYKEEYHTYARLFWACVMAVQLSLLIKGISSSLSWILSHPTFQLIAKLSFSGYLWHIPVLRLVQSTQRTPIYANWYFEIFRGFAVVVSSLLLAVPWCLMIEMPCINLERFKWETLRLFKKNKYKTLNQNEC